MNRIGMNDIVMLIGIAILVLTVVVSCYTLLNTEISIVRTGIYAVIGFLTGSVMLMCGKDM